MYTYVSGSIIMHASQGLCDKSKNGKGENALCMTALHNELTTNTKIKVCIWQNQNHNLLSMTRNPKKNLLGLIIYMECLMEYSRV